MKKYVQEGGPKQNPLKKAKRRKTKAENKNYRNRKLGNLKRS